MKTEKHEHLWKYNRRSGLWDHQRTVTPETRQAWMKIFQRDEPSETFKLAQYKPRQPPKKYKAFGSSTQPVCSTSGRKLSWADRREIRERHRMIRATGAQQGNVKKRFRMQGYHVEVFLDRPGEYCWVAQLQPRRPPRAPYEIEEFYRCGHRSVERAALSARIAVKKVINRYF